MIVEPETFANLFEQRTYFDGTFIPIKDESGVVRGFYNSVSVS